VEQSREFAYGKPAFSSAVLDGELRAIIADSQALEALKATQQKVTIMNTRNYAWRKAFLCAVFETDCAKMLAGISKATAAIEARLAAFPQPDSVEWRAIGRCPEEFGDVWGLRFSVLADAKEAPVFVRRPLH